MKKYYGKEFWVLQRPHTNKEIEIPNKRFRISDSSFKHVKHISRVEKT